jgi:DHHA1 domain
MASSIAFYAFVAVAAAGLVSVLRPVRVLRIRNRWIAAIVLFVGAVGAWRVLNAPVLAAYVTERTSKLDEFAPIYQFSESASIPVRASADRVYEALFRVTAAEVPLYRTLVWIRRGGASGPESVLNPSDYEPLIRVATRTSFMMLAEVPGREFVMGAVVMAPEGVKLAAGPALVVIARAPDVGLDAAAVLKALVQRFGGKGGGKPELAQGGGLAGARADMTAALSQLIESALRPSP